MTKHRHRTRKHTHLSIRSFLSAHRLKAVFVTLIAAIGILAGAGIVDTSSLPQWVKALEPELTTSVTASTPSTTPASTPTSLDDLAKLSWPTPQTRFATYESARKQLWAKLYTSGGTELYCGVKFAADKSNPINEKLSVEHAYPADEIAEHYPQCTDRKCKNPAAERAMADLNNLWPAILRVNFGRGKARFGEVAGGQSAMSICLDRDRG